MEFITSNIRPGRARQGMSLSEPRLAPVRRRETGITDKPAEQFRMVLETSEYNFALCDSLDNFSFHSFYSDLPHFASRSFLARQKS